MKLDDFAAELREKMQKRLEEMQQHMIDKKKEMESIMAKELERVSKGWTTTPVSGNRSQYNIQLDALRKLKQKREKEGSTRQSSRIDVILKLLHDELNAEGQEGHTEITGPEAGEVHHTTATELTHTESSVESEPGRMVFIEQRKEERDTEMPGLPNQDTTEDSRNGYTSESASMSHTSSGSKPVRVEGYIELDDVENVEFPSVDYDSENVDQPGERAAAGEEEETA